jgi:hypothetical protein
MGELDNLRNRPRIALLKDRIGFSLSFVIRFGRRVDLSVLMKIRNPAARSSLRVCRVFRQARG